ncbi:MAG: thiamine phosphate synthase, partial [Candidatus Omnitrophica bacterium]|nr:thiamine phosphate synthase [Candidatus Omnitrophota bacterium]
MNWKKNPLKDCRLYAILDRQVLGDADFRGFAMKLKGLPLDIVQLRDKISGKNTVYRNALALAGIFSKQKTLFIVNDHPDIAALVNCDGVHLGQDDLPVEAARKLLGRKKIIGVSCHSLKQALEAERRGPDYIGIGPV